MDLGQIVLIKWSLGTPDKHHYVTGFVQMELSISPGNSITGSLAKYHSMTGFVKIKLCWFYFNGTGMSSFCNIINLSFTKHRYMNGLIPMEVVHVLSFIVM